MLTMTSYRLILLVAEALKMLLMPYAAARRATLTMLIA